MSEAIKSLTREEFDAKYGAVKVRFTSYYKYSFCFSGPLPDGGRIVVWAGGDRDGIYRWNVTADADEPIAGLSVHGADIYAPGNEKPTEEFYEPC